MPNVKKLKKLIKNTKSEITTMTEAESFIRKLSREYDVVTIFKSNIDGCNAMYSENKKTITIRNPLYYTSLTNFFKDYFHELGHHLQILNGHDTQIEHNWDIVDFIKQEREAERIAYFLLKHHVPNHKLHHASFKNYISKNHKEYLKQWYFKNKNISK